MIPRGPIERAATAATAMPAKVSTSARAPPDSAIDPRSRPTGTESTSCSGASGMGNPGTRGPGADGADTDGADTDGGRAPGAGTDRPEALASSSLRNSCARASVRYASTTRESCPPACSMVSCASPRIRASNGWTTSTACIRSRRACRCRQKSTPVFRYTCSASTANRVTRQAIAE